MWYDFTWTAEVKDQVLVRFGFASPDGWFDLSPLCCRIYRRIYDMILAQRAIDRSFDRHSSC